MISKRYTKRHSHAKKTDNEKSWFMCLAEEQECYSLTDDDDGNDHANHTKHKIKTKRNKRQEIHFAKGINRNDLMII